MSSPTVAGSSSLLPGGLQKKDPPHPHSEGVMYLLRRLRTLGTSSLSEHPKEMLVFCTCSIAHAGLANCTRLLGGKRELFVLVLWFPSEKTLPASLLSRAIGRLLFVIQDYKSHCVIREASHKETAGTFLYDLKL